MIDHSVNIKIRNREYSKLTNRPSSKDSKTSIDTLKEMKCQSQIGLLLNCIPLNHSSNGGGASGMSFRASAGTAGTLEEFVLAIGFSNLYA